MESKLLWIIMWVISTIWILLNKWIHVPSLRGLFLKDFKDALLTINTRKNLETNTKTTFLFFNLLIFNKCCFVWWPTHKNLTFRASKSTMRSWFNIMEPLLKDITILQILSLLILLGRPLWPYSMLIIGWWNYIP